MINRYLELKEFINEVIMENKRSSHSNFLLVDEDDETKITKYLIDLLKPFQETTVIISGQNYLTNGLIIPSVYLILNQLKIKPSNDGFLNVLNYYLNKYP